MLVSLTKLKHYLNTKMSKEKLFLIADALTGVVLLEVADIFHRFALLLEDTTRVLQFAVFIITAYKLIHKPTKKNNG